MDRRPQGQGSYWARPQGQGGYNKDPDRRVKVGTIMDQDHRVKVAYNKDQGETKAEGTIWAEATDHKVRL